MTRTSIPQREVKALCALSGGVCPFPGCGRSLVEPGTEQDGAAFLGEIAHIVADSRQGPRGNSLMSDEDRDKHSNLLLLCGDHHKIIDSQPNTYSVPVLRQIKVDHETHIRRISSKEETEQEPEYSNEVIHSSLLSVSHLPDAVFAAPCAFRDGQEDEVKKRLMYPDDKDVLVRFLLREGRLFTFHNLNDAKGPFADVIDRRSVEPLRAVELWADAEGKRRYVTLLNRALFKFTSNLGIRYDPGHYRFFFPVEETGKEREVEYRPLNANKATRKVAWQPKRKSTGEKKKHWWHLAAGIRFHQMAGMQWCLSLRPERHLTSDDTTPLPPKQIGRRVTSMKSKMRNIDYLTEVNFWRDYLSRGTPRIVLSFGDQSAIISTEFLSFSIDWPGVPGDDESFRNVNYKEDLFTKVEYDRAISGEAISWEELDEEDPEEEEDIQEL
jgi:hypothetical protein